MLTYSSEFVKGGGPMDCNAIRLDDYNSILLSTFALNLLWMYLERPGKKTLACTLWVPGDKPIVEEKRTLSVFQVQNMRGRAGEVYKKWVGCRLSQVLTGNKTLVNACKEGKR